MFYVPANLPEGPIELRVRIKLENDSTIREGIFHKTLTVGTQQQ